MSMQPRSKAQSVTAFAPATVANVAAGFDVLGFALAGVGDRVSATRAPDVEGVRIESITGVVTDLPTDPDQNTASVAVLSLLGAARVRGGFRLWIDKGIPLGSGMGGSAASAVAAVFAANQLLERPLPKSALLPHAVAGERVASGAAHADNAAPSLHGGMLAIVSHDPPRAVTVPVPRGVGCVVVRPHLRLDTREARAALPDEIPLSRHVEQSTRLAGFLAGCFRGDLELIGRSMQDLIAEPSRSRFIPGFAQARVAALEHGAIGFGIAGAGPSVFAWVPSEEAGSRVERAVRSVFAEAGLQSDAWAGPIERNGARVEADET